MTQTIMLIDDDVCLLNSVSTYLISQHFSVSIFNNAQSALEQLSRRLPDLIIVDIMMSNIDGYQFLIIIRSNQLFYKIPVICLTAKGMTKDRIKGYDLGCNVYLTKPFNPDELLSIIKNLLKYQVKVQNSIDLPLQDKLDNFEKSNLSFAKLTGKEKIVLQLLLKGLRNKEIAEQLNISIRSVEKYVSKLLSKTSTRNRTELAQFMITKMYKGE
uniref:hypothetical protein n=1 Tax=Hypnea pseudomusciformis TaxID=1545697 RepID=UPI0027DA610D|nr:hypothetical protein P4C74_pgp016 [Hypnea pseudomusciformis]WCH55217.1 hypothetical protein [Hypnea pseudomusciformis]WCH55616.1 hypothetical protein [Hypnea pseudomusciformis]WCH56810.1 hypothetical protein [Hypnea pseudomusciformis]